MITTSLFILLDDFISTVSKASSISCFLGDLKVIKWHFVVVLSKHTILKTCQRPAHGVKLTLHVMHVIHQCQTYFYLPLLPLKKRNSIFKTFQTFIELVTHDTVKGCRQFIVSYQRKKARTKTFSLFVDICLLFR